MGNTLTIDEIFERFDNKYEAIIVIARETRRLKEMNRTLPFERRDRDSKTAIEKVVRGEVEFLYRKRVRPRPWPEMAGPEVLETKEEPVSAPPTGLWKDEDEELEEDQGEASDDEEYEEEEDEGADDSDGEVEPSAEEIMAEDLPGDSEEGEDSEEQDEDPEDSYD